MSRRAHRPQPARPPAVPVDLVQAVVEAIARGQLDGELGVLGAVINERARLLATAQAVTTLASLRVGAGPRRSPVMYQMTDSIVTTIRLSGLANHGHSLLRSP